jgi:tetratricopeptide (TPR) repeat protein
MRCRRSSLRRLAIVSAMALPAVRAEAQCADGSPPPCRSATVAAAPARRVNPPLDDRAWIIVPFDNLAKNSEVEWLRAGSVNLLYLDMSRWKDIRVVDDERVADLVREVPEANNATTLSLNAGLAIAKRAGAGKLVMGDLLKLGNRTAVTAKIFDVRTGNRLRSVREETANPDSVMPMFGKLARRILNVAPPAGANVGTIGTSSVAAYQEYIAGVEAHNKFDVRESRRRLEQALQLDSTFALAHYKLSVLGGWDNSPGNVRRQHAEAAARLGTTLPARERALIAGHLQQASGEWTRACVTYSGLVKQDSSDVEALYGLGECLFHDVTIEAVGGDTTRLRFRSDWQSAIRAFDRVLQLDPTYHLAYQHIIDALVADRHPNACFYSEPSAQCRPHTAFLVRVGDSLVATPTAIPADSAKLRRQAEEYMASRSRRRNLAAAHAVATRWLESSPNEPQARRGLTFVLLHQGRVQEAAQQVALIQGAGSFAEELRTLLVRIELATKMGRAKEAIRLYDSIRVASIPVPNNNPPTFGSAVAGYGPAFGRMVEFDSLLTATSRSQPAGFVRYQHAVLHTGRTGIAHDSLLSTERAIFDQIVAARGAFSATRQLAPAMSLTLRVPRQLWPALDTTVKDRRALAPIAMSLGDTSRLRAAARSLESFITASAAAGMADSAFAVTAADAYLILRDSVSALRVLQVSLDSLIPVTSLFPLQGGQGQSIVYYVPRMMLMRADLAAALGRKEEARTWYTRFIDLWSTAIPELQPIVERARQALAALGGS